MVVLKLLIHYILIVSTTEVVLIMRELYIRARLFKTNDVVSEFFVKISNVNI